MEDNHELITICLPAYNSEMTIKSTLESLLNQTYQNLKIIVCDNASTDNTASIVKSFKDKRIEYVYFEKYLDVNYSFIRSLNCVKGCEIVCLFHSDDWYYPDILEVEYKYIKENNVGAVFSKMNPYYDDESRIKIKDSNSNGFDKYNYSDYLNSSLKFGTIFCCPTFMTKMSVLKATGLLEKNRNMISDMSFWIEIARQFDIINLHQVLVNYRNNEKQMSKQIFNRKRITVTPQFIVLDNELDLIKEGNRIAVQKDSLKIYKRRRLKELLVIFNNLRKLKQPRFNYLKIIIFGRRLRISEVAINEKDYLDKLYGRVL